MNPKKFTVVDTRTNRTKTFESQANTVGELKADMRANGIDPDGMAIQEGLTKTELGADSSYLPHDVPYKGGTTNNLVFRLTQEEKKIKSGARSRSEVFADIKRLGLAEKVLAKYGKNFTQCKTEILEAEIEAAGKKCCGESLKTEANGDIAKAVTVLVEMLVNNGTLEEEEGNDVTAILGTSLDTDNIYSASEIDDMFKNM